MGVSLAMYIDSDGVYVGGMSFDLSICVTLLELSCKAFLVCGIEKLEVGAFLKSILVFIVVCVVVLCVGENTSLHNLL